MKTDKHIDWLSITIPNSANWRKFLPFPDLRDTGKGRHGYGKSYTDGRTGARVETDSMNDLMGTHLTLSGEVLHIMREDLGMIDDALIRRVEEFDGKCSRIDIAIDCWNATFTPEKLASAIRDGFAKLPARTWRYIDGHSNGIQGSTVDTGSSKSDRRFRFYDKRAEQRIKDGEAWVRLELQLRRLYAKSALTICDTVGVSSAVSALIGGYLIWSDEDYRTAIASDADARQTVPRRDPKRKRWLLGQVAKALASECSIDPYFRERFNQAVNWFMEQERSKC